MRAEKKGTLMINDGSFAIHFPTPEARQFELEWQRAYDEGCDRDQIAFPIAYQRM